MKSLKFIIFLLLVSTSVFSIELVDSKILFYHPIHITEECRRNINQEFLSELYYSVPRGADEYIVINVDAEVDNIFLSDAGEAILLKTSEGSSLLISSLNEVFLSKGDKIQKGSMIGKRTALNNGLSPVLLKTVFPNLEKYTYDDILDINFLNPTTMDTIFYPAGPGEVLDHGVDSFNEGLYLKIKHANGLISIYYHLATVYSTPLIIKDNLDIHLGKTGASGVIKEPTFGFKLIHEDGLDFYIDFYSD